MKALGIIALIGGIICVIGAIVSKVTLQPITFIPGGLTAKDIMGLANTLFLLAIALELVKPFKD
ncbi:hypothetical protein ACFL3J_02435 [Candidatus Omnitrophota bacterium]